MRMAVRAFGVLGLVLVNIAACSPLLGGGSGSGEADTREWDLASAEALNRRYFSLADGESTHLVILRVNNDPTFTDTAWNAPEIPALNSRITGLAYGQGTWVLVQEDGPTLWSSDTVTWVAAEGLFPGSRFESVGFTDGVFMAVTNEGAVYVSLDRARGWQEVQHSADFKSPVFQNRGADGVFLIGLADGNIYRSTDHGETWNRTGENTAGSISNFRYLGDDRWLGAGGRGIVYSDDHGQSWVQLYGEPASSATATALRGIAVHNNTAYVLGRDGGVTVDLASMEPGSPFPAAGPTGSYLEAARGVLIAGTGGSSSQDPLRYSADGAQTWSNAARPEAAVGQAWAALHERSIWLFGYGISGSSGAGALLVSKPLVETAYREDLSRVVVELAAGSSAAEVAAQLALAIGEQTPYIAESNGEQVRVSPGPEGQIQAADVDTGFRFHEAAGDALIGVRAPD